MTSASEGQARRMLARCLLCFGIVAILSATEARAGAASYNFYLAGIRLGSLEIGSERVDNRYSAIGRFETAGLLGLLDFFFDGQATGTIAPDGTVVPSRFVAASNSPRAFRHTRIDWRDGTPTLVSVEPPRSTSPDPAEQTGTLDPVSAGFRLLSDAPEELICNTTVVVFDGSRRTRLTLAPAVEDGSLLSCAGRYARLEGEAESLADLREFTFHVDFRRSANGIASVQRIEVPTKFGNATIDRHD
jgi:hypothetical protein